ncbi:MAG: hypothetical protein AAB385_05190 [Planctomycetota bacterium]
MVATRRRRAAYEALHPVHHFALAQSAHGQGKQHFAQRVPLIFLQQPDLRRARPPQPRHANLMQRAPQRRPTLAHRVPPAIHLLPALARLGHSPVPLRREQPLDGAPQLLQNLLLHLLPSLLDQIPQC